jgi:hypothetical protein
MIPRVFRSFRRAPAEVALLALCSALLSTAAAQTPPPDRCATASGEFDFWIGDWTVRWTGPDQRELEGRNRVRRALDGCAIMEEFDGTPGSPLKGISVSVYDPKRKVWKQTWVDNQASYLDFEGGFADGRMVLARSTEVNGKPVRQRMIFHGITRDAFTWDWQRSRDDGKSWETTWQLRYTRAR